MRSTQYKHGTVQLYPDLFLNDKNTGLSIFFTETLCHQMINCLFPVVLPE
jgi:hypothetical protein